MLVFKPLLMLACTIVGVTSPCEQSQDITTDSSPTAEQISAWLESGDARHIAWGAHFARETADDSATKIMVRLVEQWQSGDSHSDSAAWSRLGISYALDSLIAGRQPVTPQAVRAIRPSFPTEAIILLSKMPEVEAEPLLLDWYRERNVDRTSSYPRIAAMLLSKNPPPGFAASVLSELTVNLEINVMLPNHEFGGNVGGTSCGDGGAGAPRPGWPPLFVYTLEENNSAPGSEFEVADAGGDRITYSRISASAGWGSCFIPRQLTPVTRFHLIAEMLGLAPKRISWQPQQSTMLVWRSDERYVHDLREIIAQEESDFRSTALALRSKGYLRKGEYARPQLKVVVADRRETVSSPLPHLGVNNTRILMSYSRITSHPASKQDAK